MVSPSVMKSPGVFISEVDLSTYAALMDTSKYFGLITVAQNGPINEVVDIEKVSDYEATFGNPIDAGGLCAIFYLAQASSLKVVRTASTSASARTVSLDGKSADSAALAGALVITHKYKGTLYADAIKATVTEVEGGTPDQFRLKIVKGSNIDNPLVNKVFTIVAEKATDEVPYIINDKSSDFVYTLGTTTPIVSIDAVGDKEFSVGDNGTAVTDEEVKASIDLFDDTENIDLDFISAPGFASNAAAQIRLVTVAESREDCVAILDIPAMGLTPKEAADYIDGLNEIYPMQKIDSSYAAIYYPWGKVYNEYTAGYQWVPASVGVIAAMADEYSNAAYNAWTPPAGIPRMNISVFSEIERKLNRKDRDILYVSHINPLCNYKQLGLTAFGQKTLQRTLSSLDRLNVRFLTNYIKKIADYASVLFLFADINDETFESWCQAIDKELSNIKTKGGVYDYQITMDWTTVTDEYLNNNIMPGIIQIKPTKTAEFIPIDVVLRNKSDDFE